MHQEHFFFAFTSNSEDKNSMRAGFLCPLETACSKWKVSGFPSAGALIETEAALVCVWQYIPVGKHTPARLSSQVLGLARRRACTLICASSSCQTDCVALHTIQATALYSPRHYPGGAGATKCRVFPPLSERLCHFYQVFNLGGPQREIDEAPLLGDCNENSLGDKELWAVK